MIWKLIIFHLWLIFTSFATFLHERCHVTEKKVNLTATKKPCVCMLIVGSCSYEGGFTTELIRPLWAVLRESIDSKVSLKAGHLPNFFSEFL